MEATLQYGHKERHGSMFLTAFRLGDVGVDGFVKALGEAVSRETCGLTYVRLVRPDDTSPGVTLVWWGGDRGSWPEDESGSSESALGTPWFVTDLLDNAVETAGKAMGFTSFDKKSHSCEVK